MTLRSYLLDQKLLDQHRFADSRFTRDQHEQPAPTMGGIQNSTKFDDLVMSAHERGTRTDNRSRLGGKTAHINLIEDTHNVRCGGPESRRPIQHAKDQV